MKKLIFICFLVAVSFKNYAQSTGITITGVIVDSATGAGVELATVALRTAGKELVLNATTTDADGKFELTNNKAGSFDMVIALVGYNTKITPLKITATADLGKIKLAPSVNVLKAAVITAERREITIDAEKTTFNVAQSPSNQVGTADDLLRNMPGITVDQDGNVSITGKQGVKVLVDGKPNPQADNDLPGFLRSLPANSIESIEVINNPSAKYDAGGNAGIINIKLKKGKGDGLNVMMQAGYGILNRYNGNVNINYKKRKVNFFVNYSANDSKTGFTSVSNRTLSVNDTTSYYNYTGTGTQFRFSNNLKTGFDYSFNDQNVLTYTTSGNYSHANQLTNATAYNLDADQSTIDKYLSSNETRSFSYNISNGVAYMKKFDTTDRELDLNINYSYVESGSNVMLGSFAFDSTGNYQPANSTNQNTSAPASIHNIMAKIDYTHPLRRLKHHKIEAGFKNETTINQNVFNDYNIVNNTPQYDSLLSNQFSYTENITAVYGILSGAYNKWLTYSGGLRIENTYIASAYSAIKRNYADYFPSASMGFAINDTQNLSLSYNRRIQRPPFRYINNAITYTDQYTIWQGNPLLQPSYSNNISLAYSHSILKHLFVIKAGGSFLTNGFTGVATIDSNRITRSTEVNGVNSKAFNASAYAKLHITNWFEAQLYYNFSYSYYGFSPGINTSSIAGGTNNIWGSLRFKFWQNTALEVSGWYNTRSVKPQGANLPVGAMNASIKKSFLKDHLTVSVAANDILNSMKWRWTEQNTGITSYGSWQGTNRYVMITLSYRFGTHDLEDRKLKDENERIDSGKG